MESFRPYTNLVAGTLDFNARVDISSIAALKDQYPSTGLIYSSTAPCTPSLPTCTGGGYLLDTDTYYVPTAPGVKSCGPWWVPYNNTLGYTQSTLTNQATSGNGAFSYWTGCSSTGGARTIGFVQGRAMFMYYYSSSSFYYSALSTFPPLINNLAAGSGTSPFGPKIPSTATSDQTAGMGYRQWLFSTVIGGCLACAVAPNAGSASPTRVLYLLADAGTGLRVMQSGASYPSTTVYSTTAADMVGFMRVPSNDQALIGVMVQTVAGRSTAYASSSTGALYSFDLATLTWNNNGLAVYRAGLSSSYRGMVPVPQPVITASSYCQSPPIDPQTAGSYFAFWPNGYVLAGTTTTGATWGTQQAPVYASASFGCYAGKYGALVTITCSTVAGWGAASPPTCAPCTAAPGSFCPPNSLTAAGVVCDAGYWCAGGAADHTPCAAPAGYYCAAGTSTNSAGAGGWAQCPAGSTCLGGLAQPVAVKPFQPNSAIIVRLGDGIINYGLGTQPVFLDEYDMAVTPAVLLQSVLLPVSSVGLAAGQNVFSLHPSPGSLAAWTGKPGFLSLSADLRYLTLAGFAAPPNTTLAALAGTSVLRVIARVDWNGNVDTSTTTVYGDASNVAYSITSACTYDGSSYVFTGDYNNTVGGKALVVNFQPHGTQVASLAAVQPFTSPSALTLSASAPSSFSGGGFPIISPYDGWHQCQVSGAAFAHAHIPLISAFHRALRSAARPASSPPSHGQLTPYCASPLLCALPSVLQYYNNQLYVSHTWATAGGTNLAGDLHVPAFVGAATAANLNADFSNRHTWNNIPKGAMGFAFFDGGHRLATCDRWYQINMFNDPTSAMCAGSATSTAASAPATLAQPGYSTTAPTNAPGGGIGDQLLSCHSMAASRDGTQVWYTTDSPGGYSRTFKIYGWSANGAAGGAPGQTPPSPGAAAVYWSPMNSYWLYGEANGLYGAVAGTVIDPNDNVGGIVNTFWYMNSVAAPILKGIAQAPTNLQAAFFVAVSAANALAPSLQLVPAPSGAANTFDLHCAPGYFGAPRLGINPSTSTTSAVINGLATMCSPCAPAAAAVSPGTGLALTAVGPWDPAGFVVTCIGANIPTSNLVQRFTCLWDAATTPFVGVTSALTCAVGPTPSPTPTPSSTPSPSAQPPLPQGANQYTPAGAVGFTPGNIAVVRLAHPNIQQTSFSLSAAVWVDELVAPTNANAQLVFKQSVPLPNGTSSTPLPQYQYNLTIHGQDLVNLHDLVHGGIVSLAGDGASIVIAGINSPVGAQQPVLQTAVITNTWTAFGLSSSTPTDHMVVGTLDYAARVDISSIAALKGQKPAGLVYSATAPCTPSLPTCTGGGYLIDTDAYDTGTTSFGCGPWWVPYHNTLGYTMTATTSPGQGAYSYYRSCSSQGGGRTMALVQNSMVFSTFSRAALPAREPRSLRLNRPALTSSLAH